MKYIDTNVIISYLNNEDINHSKALKLLNNNENVTTSSVTLLELRAVLSRTTNLSENEIEAFIDYLPEVNIDIPEIDINNVLNYASEIAFKIKLKTLDILHLSACIITNANIFVTFDKDFVKKQHEILEIGIQIISI